MERDAIDAFKTYLIGERRSRYTIRSYISMVREFLEFLGRKEIAVDEEDIERYKEFLAVEKGYSKASQRLALNAVKAFLKSQRKSVPDNLRPPRGSHRVPKYLTAEEAKALLEAASGDVKASAMVSLFLYTGLRVSELCNLNISDVNLREGIITVRSGKGDKDRIVIMNERCASAVSDYLNMRKAIESKSRALFLSRKRSRYDTSSVERIIRNLARRAGIEKKVTPHVLRHTFATTMLMNGADIRFIQQLLGHSSIATTEIYTHINERALKEMYMKYEPRY
ncbi:recombinase XerC [Thermogymnomonas acidicola]|uniref:Tyrosine recombinase XerA n=1 Tax=Thermogymnomonas acidicola TaxID=399579 RepID=A0AA37BQA5_9ARCH|nr:site-specific tyrosine recombinase/integron integrase [Thermogymnomonas acidicola]GGM69537.1 recombinase XerC [Thermogymnomonas acidicola]